MRKKKSNFNIIMATIGVIMIQLGMCLVKIDSALAIDGYNIPLNTMVDVEASLTLTMNEESSNEDASLNAGNDIDTDEAGKIIRRTANIELGNTSGYTVSIKGGSNLVGKNTGNIIPSVTDATTLGQMKNNWGWAGSVGVNISNCNPATISFKGMDDEEQILGSGGAVKSGNRKVTMCFGARINGEQVADVYSNTVTLSVVAQPGQVAAFNGITQM